jgi:hypothetical protein
MKVSEKMPTWAGIEPRSSCTEGVTRDDLYV